VANEESGEVFLDACCLINLFATDRPGEILAALPHRFAVSRYVAEKEVLRVRTPEGPRRFTVEELAHAGHLAIFDLESEAELAQWVRFASVLDDGEASICALAITRGGRVATDDRKAIRILGEQQPEIRVLQTPELLHAWAHEATVTEKELRQTLAATRERARFIPRRDVPHAEWWHRYFQS